MKIECSQADFSAAISIVSKAVAVRSTATIMQCILITAYDNEIKLTANNNSLGIETYLNGTIHEEGTIAVDAKRFEEIIHSLNDVQTSIVMTTNDNQAVEIVGDGVKVDTFGRSGEDFTYLPQIEQENGVEISQFALKEIIRQTIFSTIESETNPAMGGEQFAIKENSLQVSSIDGHRFALRRINLNDNYENRSVIVPAKTLNELMKILKDDDNEIVQLFFSSNHMMFLFDETTVVTRLIEGEFIDIQRMIVNDFETTFTVSKKHMQDCMRRAVMISRSGNKKPIIMNISENSLKIELKTAESGLEEEIEIEKQGKNLKIGFNPSFFMDVLNVVEDENVTFYMGDARYPCFIKNESQTYQYMVLPVNI
ncbi:MAG: DNA polymerase III subunit beta [Eubacterium sp.]|nr:DNA polymerase III subunit beta [Eubacterium sp.]